MRTDHQQSHANSADQVSDILADLSLNSFGLVLIILLLHLIVAQRLSADRRATADPMDRSVSVSKTTTLSDLEREFESLKRTSQIDTDAERDSGLWCFSIHVKRLVASDKSTQEADMHVDYFCHINIRNGKVTGALLGTRDSDVPSANSAQIRGHHNGNQMRLELHFTRQADGASEILNLRREGDQWIGSLSCGALKPNFQNYEGTVVGNRITNNVFSQST